MVDIRFGVRHRFTKGAANDNNDFLFRGVVSDTELFTASRTAGNFQDCNIAGGHTLPLQGPSRLFYSIMPAATVSLLSSTRMKPPVCRFTL